MLQEFIDYLHEQLENRSIYIWGGQGQAWPTLTEKWITQKERGTHRTNALALYRAAVRDGFRERLRAFDCSGLGMYYLQNLKRLSKNDMTSNGMKGRCTLIQKSHLKKGDWVFRVYKSGSKKGRAYHIGYVVDEALNVIEARGRAYGVVKRPLNASGAGYWNVFGRPSYFAAEIDSPTQRREHASFNRLLRRGTKGDDVLALQRLLNRAGDDIKEDGDFGSKTRAAVRAFQKKNGLKTDGIAGRLTITALGGVWLGA